MELTMCMGCNGQQITEKYVTDCKNVWHKLCLAKLSLVFNGTGTFLYKPASSP